jgi:acyl dehydratase
MTQQTESSLKIDEGHIFTLQFQYSQEQVEQYALLTGDDNPVHLDAAFAATTLFKKPIMHGMLSASIFSRIFGTLFPGQGSIYLKQNLSFLKPMYAAHIYEAVCEVKSVDKRRHRAIVSTSVKHLETGDVTIEGEAEIMNRDRF